MRFLLLIISIIFNIFSYAQKVTKYYDAEWMPVSRDKAVYYADFIKDGNLYKCTSYWVAGNAIRGRSTFADTVMEKAIGAQVLYFKNGHVEDSAFYGDGTIKYIYHYYPNNKLAMHYYLPDNSKEAISEGYDEDGKKIKNFIFEKEAEFKGGQKAWLSYVAKNASKDLTVKAEGVITATAKIKFIINEDGSVAREIVLQSSGYKEIDRDALRVISDSPLWNNAIQYNRPLRLYGYNLLLIL